MNSILSRILITAALLTSLCVAGLGVENASAQLKTRIAVLPFYVEQGAPADTGHRDMGLHYRRMSGFIENHLLDHDFEVIDPFARDAAEKELDRVMERARTDSMTVATNMCQRYGVDAVYIVWLKVKTVRTGDGYVKAIAILDGKGYDSAGHSLGANILKTLTVTKRDFDQAVSTAEQEVGNEVGRTLTAWHQNRHLDGRENSGTAPGILAQNIDAQEQFLTIRLSRATSYELVEAFGKVLITVRGVKEAKQYSQRIVPDKPQVCISEWEVEIDTNETDSFRLQANIMKMVNDILDAGGTIRLKGIPYRYTPGEMSLMMGLTPGENTTRTIQFVVDAERARQRKLAGRHDPEKAVYRGNGILTD